VVEYKKGGENKVVDALSRREESVDVTQLNEGSLFLISFPFPSWIEELKLSYQLLLEVQKFFQDLKSGSSGPKHFSLHNGLILYKGRVILGPNCNLIPKIL